MMNNFGELVFYTPKEKTPKNNQTVLFYDSCGFFYKGTYCDGYFVNWQYHFNIEAKEVELWTPADCCEYWHKMSDRPQIPENYSCNCVNVVVEYDDRSRVNFRYAIEAEVNGNKYGRFFDADNRRMDEENMMRWRC